MTTKPDAIGHRQRLKGKFLLDFGRTMPDYELLELYLTIALPRQDVKPMAKALIAKFGNVHAVVSAEIEDLIKIKGIKETSATSLKIVAAISARAMWQKASESDNDIITGWDDLMDYCIGQMRYNKVEVFKVVFLDANGKITGEKILQEGTVDSVFVYAREVIKEVLLAKAKSVVFIHNHPSGKTTPSTDDINLTKTLTDALSTIDVGVWDHVIIGNGEYYSFKHKGLL